MIEKYTLIPNTQNGFRPAKETTFCINQLIAQIRAAQNKQAALHVAYIDFTKAFDLVPYWAIEHTLQSMHFSEHFTANIMELFKNIYTQFKTKHGYTDKVFMQSGVRQGDIISPTLFILSTAPLLWKIHETPLAPLSTQEEQSVYTFADDTVLLATNQDDIRKIFKLTTEFSSDLGMPINAKKSGYAWMNDEPAELTYKGQTLKLLSDRLSYKYLGVFINLQLNFTKHYQIQHKDTSISLQPSAKSRKLTQNTELN